MPEPSRKGEPGTASLGTEAEQQKWDFVDDERESDDDLVDTYRSVFRSATLAPQSLPAVPDGLQSSKMSARIQEKNLFANTPVENRSFEPQKRGLSGAGQTMLTHRTAEAQGETIYNKAQEILTAWIMQQEKQPQAENIKPAKARTNKMSLQRRLDEQTSRMTKLVEELWHMVHLSTTTARKQLGVKAAQGSAREILPAPELIARTMTKDIVAPRLPEHFNRACSFVAQLPATALFFIVINWLSAARDAGDKQCGGSDHFDIEFDHKLRDFKIRGAVYVNDSWAGWNLHIFEIAEQGPLGVEYPRRRLVEIQRRDGDAFAFSAFYNRLACHVYQVSQDAPAALTKWSRSPGFYKMYSPWPEEGEFVIEPQCTPNWHGLPEMEHEYRNYGMLNLARDPSCARIFIGMLKNRYGEIKAQAISSIAKAIRYPLNKAILLQHKSEILNEVIQVLKESRNHLSVRCALVILREAFRVDITLWEAAGHARGDIVSTLLARGTNPDECNASNRRTPLMYALDENDLEIARELLDAKANPELVAADGRRARDFATPAGRRLLSEFATQSEATGKPAGAAPRAKQLNMFSDKQRLQAVRLVAEYVLAHQKWASPNNAKHPSSPVVTLEAVMAIKQIIGLRENFSNTIVELSDKFRQLLQGIERDVLRNYTYCGGPCVCCSAARRAHGERRRTAGNRSGDRSRRRVPAEAPACLLQPFHQAYNQLQKLVDAVC